MIRNPIAFVPYLIALAAVIGGLLSYAGDKAAGIDHRPAAIGGSFALVDQNGTPRTDTDFHGRTLLVYFGFTHCPDVCPTTLAVVAGALEQLGPVGQHLIPIFVSVDPARDTPAVLKPYLASFGPRFVGLTGSAQAIEAIKKDYRVYAVREPLEGGGYAMTHSNTLYLIGPNGKFITHFDETLGPEKLAEALRKYL